MHRAYLAAGADAVKTNTFGLPRMAAAQNPVWEALADEGWKLAVQAAAETGAAVFADIGPAPDTEAQPAAQLYIALADRFAALGAKNFLFETLSTDTGVTEAAQHIKKRCRTPSFWCPLRCCRTAIPARAATARSLCAV